MSEYQLGLAMDVTSAAVGFDLLESFGATAEGQFIRDHAHEYGFIVRYAQGKTNITGYAYEPWHLTLCGCCRGNHHLQQRKNHGRVLRDLLIGLIIT